jgi:hypothetical protein
VELQQGEYVIWMEYPASYYLINVLAAVGIGSGLMLLMFLLSLGLIIIIISVTTLILNRRVNKYVVTNKRAMHIKFGKVWKQVDLSTPGLFISTVNPKTVFAAYVQDVVFIVKGMEVLRFSEIRRSDELMAKLRSLGFQ